MAPCFYDSLDALKPDMAAAPATAMAVFGVEHAGAPKRLNAQRQAGAQCGHWAIYFAEEHCRRQVGERKWGAGFNLAYRHQRLTAML